MWILENEGDILQGKRLWLRPGKKFLFGRTQQDDAGGGFIVSDKTISRQHLMVEVEAVPASECGNARSRSKVTLKDLNTKIGTLVNGEQIRGKSHVLQSDENVVTLGKYKYHFYFTWVPITFTFSFTTKEQKADPFTKLYELLGPLDIKVLVEYEAGLTTHLAAKKRNTSRGLQALIDGKFIVHNETFIQAIVDAATSLGDDLSPLEEDFEDNFPNELEYLPPRGEEPTQRDGSAYAPDPKRHDMFDGYTFVFYEKRQFENLLAPITQGRGKALLREAIQYETELDDFVRYVKDVAGEKGLGEFEDGSEGKGVVVVRFNPVKGVGTEWFADFGRQVSLHLGHRLVEQNEFLDAILGNDASVLRRPLEVEMSAFSARTPSAITVRSTQITQAPEASPPPPALEPVRRGRPRRPPATRFKGFDDDDDFGTPLGSITESMVVDATPAVQSQSQSLFVSQDPDAENHREPSQLPEPLARYSRKRPAPVEVDIMEAMAPAAAALKRRRLAEETARRHRGESTPPPPPAPKEQPAATKKLRKKSKPQIDVMEVARQQREKAEDLAREEREALVRDLDGMDIDAIRDLAIVEEMEVSRANPPPRAASRAGESERWDDKWNGRRNFKKFRRHGAQGGNVRAASRVIVQLEEVKKKDFGIGNDYWLEGDKDSQRKKKKEKGKETQGAQSQSQVKGKGKSRAAERASEILLSEVEDELNQSERVASSSDVEIVAQPPKSAQRSQKSTDKTSKSRNLPTNNKRPAATTITKPVPAKKPRQNLIRREESDDSDEDGLRFKFKRK